MGEPISLEDINEICRVVHVGDHADISFFIHQIDVESALSESDYVERYSEFIDSFDEYEYRVGSFGEYDDYDDFCLKR